MNKEQDKKDKKQDKKDKKQDKKDKKCPVCNYPIKRGYVKATKQTLNVCTNAGCYHMERTK